MTRRIVAMSVLAGLLIAGSTACGSTASPTATPSGVYPVATVPSSIVAVPTVLAGGYQLVAAGDPVDATVDGAHVRIVAQGPDVAVRTKADGSIDHENAEGTITVAVSVLAGRLTVPASSFLTLDEKQDPVRTTSDRASLDLTEGQKGSLAVRALFTSGHTTLTWQPLGKPMITWDFTIELD